VIVSVAVPLLIFVHDAVAALVVQVCAAGIVPVVGGCWSRPHTNSFAVSLADWVIVKVIWVPTAGWVVSGLNPGVIAGGSGLFGYAAK
jgi:hypothetical protein